MCDERSAPLHAEVHNRVEVRLRGETHDLVPQLLMVGERAASADSEPAADSARRIGDRGVTDHLERMRRCRWVEVEDGGGIDQQQTAPVRLDAQVKAISSPNLKGRGSVTVRARSDCSKARGSPSAATTEVTANREV